jgi:predicted metalloprotease with PDZ domain
MDLSLREQSDSGRTLDTYMQTLWARFGRPGQKVPGLVATAYTMGDLRAALAELTTKQFADTFFDRYIQGHDVVDYAPLLAEAGLVVRKRGAGRAYLVTPQLTMQAGGARVMGSVLFDSALYKAGVDREDLIAAIDGVNITSQEVLDQLLAKHKPGAQVPLRYVRRGGEIVNTTLTLEEDPRIEVVTVESTGGTPTAEQKQFRDRWFGSRAAQ